MCTGWALGLMSMCTLQIKQRVVLCGDGKKVSILFGIDVVLLGNKYLSHWSIDI
jgi:hypothetical protein